MLRSLLLSIVLAFTAGANASLLCKVWCHPAVGPTQCHREDPSDLVGVAANDGCNDVVLGAVEFTREHLRTDLSDRDTANVVVPALFRFVDATASLDFVAHPGRASALERRPLITVLRI